MTQCESSGPNRVASLTPADGLILADAHPGITVNGLRAINPSVREGQDREVVAVDAHNPPIKPLKRLDPFDLDNGYNPNGDSNYSKKFQQDYTVAQADRMNEWINQALRIQSLMAQVTGASPITIPSLLPAVVALKQVEEMAPTFSYQTSTFFAAQ